MSAQVFVFGRPVISIPPAHLKLGHYCDKQDPYHFSTRPVEVTNEYFNCDICSRLTRVFPKNNSGLESCIDCWKWFVGESSSYYREPDDSDFEFVKPIDLNQ